jgi:hypothetical protein
MATICPFVPKKHEAENILKTKDRKGRFSANEAENILKRKMVTKNCRKPEKR